MAGTLMSKEGGIDVRAGRIVCFGELLLRLSAPGRERLLQSKSLDVYVGGAEANVAVSLVQFGHDVSFAGTVADNPLGDAAIGELRRFGIRTSGIRRTAGRMGLYFMTAGALQRPSEIYYDRAGSAFALTPPDAYDWDAEMSGAKWAVLSGVTPAIGNDAARCAIAAARAASRAGAGVVFDGNYRGKLWAAWDGDGPAILREIMEYATVAFINERDIDLLLGTSFAKADDCVEAIDAAFAAFPALQWIACTKRVQDSVDAHELSGAIYGRHDHATSRMYRMSHVVERIGSGDAFAAGVLDGLIRERPLKEVVEFGVAASVMKHSIPGDYSIASRAEIEAILADSGLDVRR